MISTIADFWIGVFMSYNIHFIILMTHIIKGPSVSLETIMPSSDISSTDHKSDQSNA